MVPQFDVSSIKLGCRLTRYIMTCQAKTAENAEKDGSKDRDLLEEHTSILLSAYLLCRQQSNVMRKEAKLYNRFW